MAEWLTNLIRLAFFLRPPTAWTTLQRMWMDLRVPIFLDTHKGFLDHAIQIAMETEREMVKSKKTQVFSPSVPLPSLVDHPIPPVGLLPAC
jgi:hypothetical protein